MSGPILPTSFFIPEDYLKARVVLIDDIQRIKRAINRKSTGEYYEQEVNTAQSLFGGTSNNKTVFRKTIDFGALPDNASKSVAHGIPFDSNYKFLKIFGSSTDQTAISAIPLPYSSPTLTDNISLEVDGTNVTVTTGADYSAYTETLIILEYVKF